VNLFDLFIKIGVDDQATGYINNLSTALGTGLKTAAKIGTTAVGTTVAGITALTKQSVDEYKEYEQLVGGVDTLFKESSDTLQDYADDAYLTAGLSANNYMDTVTGFAASLLQSLEWDTEEAVKYADMAISDMSDNANKMGTNIGMIQNAYQGFAKQNYTMLDNLKLGYGGTASEMYRLLETAAELDETFAQTANFSFDSKGHLTAEFADIVNAIHIVQDEMGITGTTAQEAGTTIEGSVAAMQGAYKNLIVGLATDNADIEQLTKNLVNTVFGDGTDKNLGVFGTVAPTVERVLWSIGVLVESSGGMVGGLLNKIGEYAPDFVDTAVDLVSSFTSGLSEDEESKKKIIQGASDIIFTLANGFLEITPDIFKIGGDVLGGIITGLTDPEKLGGLRDSAGAIIKELLWQLTSEETFETLGKAAENLGKFILETLLTAATDIFGLYGSILSESLGKLKYELPILFNGGFNLPSIDGTGGGGGKFSPSQTSSDNASVVVNQYITAPADTSPSALMGEALYQQKLAVMSGVSY
jgi:hypothetical protein